MRERVGREHGFSEAIRVDWRGGFVSRELNLWAYQRGVTLDVSRPGEPKDNAFIESLNGQFRAACLNAHWFVSLDDAWAKCEGWRGDHNKVRQHNGIGNSPPASQMESVSGTRPKADPIALEGARQGDPRMGSRSD